MNINEVKNNLLEIERLVTGARDDLINLQPHIAQLPKQYRIFIDSHVDVALEKLLKIIPHGGNNDV